jgi:hypothetical protein
MANLARLDNDWTHTALKNMRCRCQPHWAGTYYRD